MVLPSSDTQGLIDRGEIEGNKVGKSVPMKVYKNGKIAPRQLLLLNHFQKT